MSELLKNNYDRMLDCIHCGLCLPSCPSYAVLGTEMDSPRGRVFLMKAVTDNRLQINDNVTKHFDSCLACRGCETSCPSGVQYHTLLEMMQQSVWDTKAVKMSFWKNILLNKVFNYPGRLKFAFRLLRIYQNTGIQTLIRSTGLIKMFSKKASIAEGILPRIKSINQITNKACSGENKKGNTIGFLRGCVMDYFYPGTNISSVKLLEYCGYNVSIPEEQHCCGAMHLHNGETETAREYAKKIIDQFGEYNIVVTNAAGCGAALKEYDKFLKNDPEYRNKASAFVEKVKDITEVLYDHINSFEFNDVKKKIVFDIPCHLIHGQKVKNQPLELLQAIPGLTILSLKESEMCCGSAGTFNIEQPELAEKILNRKMLNINESDADTVATANIGCMIQIQYGISKTESKVQLFHIIDILDIALKEKKG